MSISRKLGIWMDHANAHLIEFTSGPAQISKIVSEFNSLEKKSSIQKGEQLMHNKEQGDLSSYFKKLGSEIVKYNSVLLFGPTTAKTELLHQLRVDNKFDKTEIITVDTDRMTANQQHAFVQEHFTKH